MTIAWVFPGQGSQKLGMADTLLELSGARERFELASEILNRDLLKIISDNDNQTNQIEDLNDTRNTQPALFVVESLLVDDLIRQGRKASLVAGHSLGEIVALYAADVFDVETALKLLKCRSELMARAGGGAMFAVMGFERDQLNALVDSTEGVVIANDNSTSQVVLSGNPEAVESVTSILKCKRAIPLQVSGAFHSPFMEKASEEFSKELDLINFNKASVPVLSNFDPTPTCDPIKLKEKLRSQMTSGVRWRETMDLMVKEGINTIIEIGPGKVLGGLAKRSLKGIVTSHVSNSTDLGY